MSRIIFDCQLMKNRDSGLYYYCLNLGLAMNSILKAEGKIPVGFYVPELEAGTFNDPANTIIKKSWHKYYKPFLKDCKLWHWPFQSGSIVPAARKNVKVLLTIHDLNVLHEDVPKDKKEKSLGNTRRLISRSDALVFVSEFSKKDVLENCDVGNRPLYVIHNGLNDLSEACLSSASYKPSRPFLFAIGFVNRKKNFHSLLPLLQSNPGIELVIAGKLDDADYVEFIKKDASNNGNSDRLRIVGPVSESEKAWYMQHCLAYMHPSLAEGFGLPVVEAMHYGKPMFLSNLTSLPEIGGEVAFYFRNFESEGMNQVFQSGIEQYKAKDMATRIKERGNQFSWKKAAGDYLKVYELLAGKW